MVKGCGAETRWLFRAPRESGLATNALVREGFDESLRVEVLVPQCREPFVFAVKLRVKGVLTLTNEAAPLLYSGVVVAVVERRKLWAAHCDKLEAHLRVAHGVAVQFAVVSDRDSRKSAGAGLVH